jgi:uncharacterized protein (TIGR03089 family)
VTTLAGRTTFPDLLSARLRATPAQPLITAYDDATGERVELSVMTYANWVSKTANLLTDELMLDPGDVLLVDLPAHWLVPIFLGAAWSAGLVVSTDPTADVALVVCGPQVAPHVDRGVPVLATALLPFGVRLPEPVAAPVLDYGLLWPGQSDVFSPVAPIDADDIAWRGPDGELSQRDLLGRAAGRDRGIRLLTDVNPLDDLGGSFLGPLLADGSVVLVRNPEITKWPARHDSERATSERRAGQPAS